MSEEFSGSDIWHFLEYATRATLLHHLPKRHRTSEQLPCPSSSGDLIGILYGLDWTASMEWGTQPSRHLMFPCPPMLSHDPPVVAVRIGLHRPRLGDVTNVEEKRF
jgi:hypothetical protein